MRTRNRLLAPLLAALASLAVLLVASGCGGTSSDASSGGDGSGGKLTLVAYSTPEEAYKELIPAFNKTADGKGVGFNQSYAASGEQSRAVEGGLPADVVEFSLEPDMTRLVDADLVDKDWNQNEYKGIVTNSVVVFMVRKGNPKNIKNWDDLDQAGDVEVIEPEPVHLGRREVEHHGRLRRPARGGQDATEEAQEYLDEAVQERAGARQERARVAPDVLERQGRRAARLRERGDPRPAEGRGRSTTSSPTRRS